MKCWIIVALSAAFLVSCYGHTIHMGRTCPTVKAFPNLSVNKVLGNWYVAYQFDTSNTCLVWNITRPISQLEQLDVVETRQISVLDTLGIDHKHSVSGRIDIPNPEIPSKMRIRWLTSLTGKADFTVFDTDYENYMAIFQCDRAGFLHRRDVTILSRTKNIDEMFVARIRRLLSTVDIPHESLTQISHHMCRDQTLRDWHIDSELFGLLPKSKNEGLVEKLADAVDISEIEIFNDGN